MVILAAASAILQVSNIISEYSGYRKGKIKEDDLLVRKRLESEILKAQEHVKNIREFMHEKKNQEGIKGLTKVRDELDIFSNEIKLSIVGHKYAFFSIQTARSPTEADLNRLVQFDVNMLESLVNVTETMVRIEDHAIDNTSIDHATELAKIRQYITKSRNKFKDREDFLRGWK